jgi:hypothetical protein
LVALISSDLICRACNGELGDDRNHVCKRCGVRVHSWVKCASAVRVDDVYWCSEQCKTGNIIINWHLYDMVYIYAATLDEQRSKTRTGEVDTPLHIVIEDKAEADTQQPPHQKKGVMKEMKNEETAEMEEEEEKKDKCEGDKGEEKCEKGDKEENREKNDVLPSVSPSLPLVRVREVQCEEYTLYLRRGFTCVGDSGSSYHYMDAVWGTAASHTSEFIGFYLGYTKDRAYKTRMLVWTRQGSVGTLSWNGYNSQKVKWTLTSTCPSSVDCPETPDQECVKRGIESYIKTLRPAPKGTHGQPSQMYHLVLISKCIGHTICYM